MIASLKLKLSKLTAVAIGQVTHDRYGDQIVPGGCAFFGAKTFWQLGATSCLLTSIGKDFSCNEALVGLKTKQLIKGETTVFSNLYPPGKPRLQLVESQALPITADMYPQKWLNPDLLFVAPVMGEMKPITWSNVACAKYTTVGLQGFMKKAGDDKTDGKATVVALKNFIYTDLLNGVDAVFLSDEDIKLFGSFNLLLQLRKLVKIVIVTLGDKGCDIYQNNKIFKVGVYKTNSIDPTGAGDTFAAATSLALAAGVKVNEAATLGAAAASVIVEDNGGKNIKHIAKSFTRMSLVF